MTAATRSPHLMDSKIASAVRAQRTLAGVSQAELGSRIGVSWQQVQKYESGANRVSASRLWSIAEALRIPLTQLLEPPPIKADGPYDTKTIIELVRTYQTLGEHKRQLVRDFVNTLAAG